jgi:hypothetical protein
MQFSWNNRDSCHDITSHFLALNVKQRGSVKVLVVLAEFRESLSPSELKSPFACLMPLTISDGSSTVRMRRGASGIRRGDNLADPFLIESFVSVLTLQNLKV